jgi:hypothetical protein
MNQATPYASLCFLLALAGCSKDTASGAASGNEALTFNWDVRPIISDNCFACHGPDAEGGQKAGLRLDLFETATAELPESPGGFAIVPGDPDASELIRRINSTDPDVMMPPPDSNKTLADDEKQLLASWIEQGARYERHWAYVPVARPTVPETAVADSSAIDAFIAERLAAAGLTAAPQADKATLINRLYLDLTGLPPSLEVVDTFVADTTADAYENAVDSLLASTAHAEHMTAQWLDIARWADTDGYLEDAGNRLLYPWRDWVISAYRDNLPFDDFITWQLAGDLLPDATQEQRLATAFLRLGQRSSENGIIAEEYKNEYAIDRVETLGVGILGHTVGCARCHDHKYDPITIKDFYSFAAFFSDTREPGFYTPGGTLPAQGFLGVESGATLNLPDAETAATLAALETQLAGLTQEYRNVVAATQQRHSALAGEPSAMDQVKQELAAAVDSALAAHYSFESVYEGDLDFARIDIFGRQEQGKPMAVSRGMPAGIREDLVRLSASNIPGQVQAVLQSPILGEGIKGSAFVFDEQNKGYFGGDVGDYDRTDAFTLDFWIRFDSVYDVATVLNHNQHIRFASNGYTLDVENNHLRFDMVHTPDNKISVISEEAVAPGAWRHITVSYDGSSTAAGIKLYLDAEPLAVRVLGDNLSQTIVTAPLAFIDDTHYGLGFGKRWQQYTPTGSALDEVKVFNRDLSALEIAWLHSDGQAVTTPELYQEFRVMTDPDVLAAKAAVREVDAQHNQLVSWQPEIMVMGDDPLAAPMQVKKRGVYSDPGEPVAAQAFDQIFAWDASLPANRLGLAQWLFDRSNPLTSRVYANRLWQSLFGRGLVETAEDFGTQGAIPSHPLLLDWLAAELMEQDWDTRHLLKLMVMSSTYRQDSNVDALKKERDPFNQLLSRGVRLRHSAEVIRDNALAAAGLLNDTSGGPSVHPYQPEGVWLAVSVNQPVDYPRADQVPLDEHHRRTMYGYVKRASQHPALQVFDFPQRITTVARRRTSNTPLQALALLNDEQYLEAYEGMAYRALQQSTELAQQIAHLYRLGLRREASAQESTVLTEHYHRSFQRFTEDADRARDYLGAGLVSFDIEDGQLAQFAALASTARIVMNSPDAYTRR